MFRSHRRLAPPLLLAMLFLMSCLAFACGDDDGKTKEDTTADVVEDNGTDTNGTDTNGTDTNGTDTNGTDTNGTDTNTDTAVTCDQTGFTPVAQDAASDGESFLVLNAYDSAAAPFNWMSLELWAGTGNDPALNGTGTYELGSSADELNYATCGTCILISTDCDENGCNRDFLANAGTLDITDLSLINAPIAGTLTDVTLIEVTVDWGDTWVSTPVAGGETWCIDSMSFGTTVTWPACDADEDCVDSPDGSLCEVDSGVCVECLDNTDCDAGANEICDTTTWTCEVQTGPTDRLGCMDSDAVNYDANATVDNGYCMYTVTFTVDTTGHTVNTGVDVIGSWDWNATPVQLTNNNGVYTGTLTLFAGRYEYVYRIDGVNEDIADDDDTTNGFCDVVPDNATDYRGFIVMDAPLTLPELAFGTCDAVEGCTDANATNYNASATLDIGVCTYDVTFQANTTGVTVNTGVTLIGSWNWAGTPIAMTDGNTDGTYDATIALRPGSYAFLFQVDGADEDLPDDDDTTNGFCDAVADNAVDRRGFELGMADLTLPAEPIGVCSGAIAACADSDAANYHTGATADFGKCLYDVTFSVDVSALSTAPTSVGVFGSWDAWCETCGPMTDGGSGVWSATLELPAGRHEFKFLTGNSGANSEPLPDDDDTTAGFCDVVPDNDFNNRAIGVGTAPLTVPSMTWGVCL